MLGRLKQPEKKLLPFSEEISRYIRYMRNDQGLSENTIKLCSDQLEDFFKHLNSKRSLKNINAIDIDNFFMKKFNEGCQRATLRRYGSSLRSFFKFSEANKWCRSNIVQSIKTPRVYKNENLPLSPSWHDVNQHA